MPNDAAIGFGKIALGLRFTKASSLFLDSWNSLLQSGLRAGDKVLPVASDLPHHFAAEILVWQFLKTDCDSLLLVDDDHGFECDILHRLRDNAVNQTFDVVGAMYACRRPQYKPIIMFHDLKTGNFGMRPPVDPRGTEPVDLMGLGFTLIRRKVLEAIKRDNPAEMMFYWPADGDGEDSTFCRLAKATGARLGVDTTLCVDHQVNALVRCSPIKAEVTLEAEVNTPFMSMMEDLRLEKKKALEARIARTKAKEKET